MNHQLQKLFDLRLKSHRFAIGSNIFSHMNPLTIFIRKPSIRMESLREISSIGQDIH
jgi:hypothetical protein